jgi:hypothetical protein
MNLGNRASQPHFTLADLRSTAVLLQLILMDFFFVLLYSFCARGNDGAKHRPALIYI